MSADLHPLDVRCEYRINPLGIDVAVPRLSWALVAEQRGQRQAGYQILVSSSAERLATDVGDLWDSGYVASEQSVHRVYGGQPLASGQRSWWKVRVWDQQGQPSTYSSAAWWEMGLLRPEEWQAQWIGVEPPLPVEPMPVFTKRLRKGRLAGLIASPYLRKSVVVPQSVQRARLYVTAKGLYICSINGQRVGNALLTPGWTDYDRRIQYQSYDVTELLRPGPNVLGAILGTGWYSGYVGFGRQCRHYGTRPQLLLQLQLEYVDGTTATIISDGTWKAASGPITFSDLLMGESYDARAELVDWDQVDFDDRSWQPVDVRPCDATLLVSSCDQPVAITEELTPVDIKRIGRDSYLADMGQNMTGWVRLKVQGKAGRQIRLRFVEILDAKGRVYTTNLRAARQTDTYILRGGGPEVWEPHFTFHGFRYVEVQGYPGDLTPDALTGCVVHSATLLTGTFQCSHPMVNQLARNITWGQRGNFLSIPTDCPQRDERLGWLGDAQIFIRTACLNMDVAAFFTKWMRDVADGQSAAGGFPDVAPRLVDLSDGAPAWGDAGIIVPWTIYQSYADTRIIEEHWDAMVRWMAYLEQANPGWLRIGRLNNNFGDWLSIKAETPPDVLATAYWAYDAQLMAQMARAIGHEAEASAYEQLFGEIKAAFIAAYVADDGTIKGETQTAYVLALHMQLLPDELRPQAVQHLVADIERRDWHLSTGFVGVGYLLPVLTAGGRQDVAYRLLLNDTFPSWGYSIKHGATTIWERWDGWTEEGGFQDPGMNSFNHYSLGSVGEWLYRFVGGIDVDAMQPGYQHILIHPQPGGELTSARAEYASIRGNIISEWQLEGDVFSLQVTIPANTTATIVMPTNIATEVTEGARLAAQAEGVRFVRQEANRAFFEIIGGSYDFTGHMSSVERTTG
ncbi:MAG: family 78 glycoside hydrolase catalytic domain [Herpetosiphonaceae bacterium]|nr:family 78 glycoside hydrolase catalytic domain [Herpetosiphonaceae bacterium]